MAMKKVMLWLLALSCLVCVLPASGCSRDKIYFTEEPYSMEAGDTFTLEVDSFNPVGKVTYFSSNPDVAWVEEDGVITAVKPGDVTIKVWKNSDKDNLDEVSFNVDYKVEYDVVEPQWRPQMSEVGKSSSLFSENNYVYR